MTNICTVRLFRLLVLAIFLCTFTSSCAKPINIIRTQSKQIRPIWIEKSIDSGDELYFLGIKSDARSLEDGLLAAQKDAYEKISSYIGTTIKSELNIVATRENSSVKQIINTTSNALISEAKEYERYYEKIERTEGNYKSEKFDVYIIFKFSKSCVEKELDRQKTEVELKIKNLCLFYNNAQKMKPIDSIAELKKIVNALENISGIYPCDACDCANNMELLGKVRGKLLERSETIKKMRVNYKVSDSLNSFSSNFEKELTSAGYTLVDSGEYFTVNTDILSRRGGEYSGNIAYLVSGSVGVIDRASKMKLLNVNVEGKGFHRETTRSMQFALENAGASAGTNLVAAMKERFSLD